MMMNPSASPSPMKKKRILKWKGKKKGKKGSKEKMPMKSPEGMR